MRAHEFVTEKWTQKYKKSINCASPKGFSQKAHCAGRKKNEGVAEGDVVPLGKKHRGDLDSVNSCSKCGGKLEGGTYMGQTIKVCLPCKQVYLPPNSGIDQQGNKTNEQAVTENFADGKKPGRKGLAKRVGVDCKQPVTKLRSIAANSSGERQRMAHWCANMKSGKQK